MAIEDQYVQLVSLWKTFDSANDLSDIQDLTFQNIARSTQISKASPWDTDLAARPPLIVVQGHFEFATSPVVDETVQVWLADYGEAADEPPNSVIGGTTEAQLTNLNALYGCKLAGQGRVASTTAADNVGFTAILEWTSPQIQVLVLNNSAADNLVNSASLSWVKIWNAVYRRQIVA